MFCTQNKKAKRNFKNVNNNKWITIPTKTNKDHPIIFEISRIKKIINNNTIIGFELDDQSYYEADVKYLSNKDSCKIINWCIMNDIPFESK